MSFVLFLGGCFKHAFQLAPPFNKSEKSPPDKTYKLFTARQKNFQGQTSQMAHTSFSKQTHKSPFLTFLFSTSVRKWASQFYPTSLAHFFRLKQNVGRIPSSVSRVVPCSLSLSYVLPSSLPSIHSSRNDFFIEERFWLQFSFNVKLERNVNSTLSKRCKATTVTATFFLLYFPHSLLVLSLICQDVFGFLEN